MDIIDLIGTDFRTLMVVVGIYCFEWKGTEIRVKMVVVGIMNWLADKWWKENVTFEDCLVYKAGEIIITEWLKLPTLLLLWETRDETLYLHQWLNS